MAHDLSVKDGKAEMMYVGEVPWHGLGRQLNQPATSAEAIKAAGLDWEVIKVPLFTKSQRRYTATNVRFATMRSDEKNGAIFGIVGKRYRPLQNSEAFGWFDGIVGEGAAIYHTAGALGKGERVWILAKLPGSIQVVGEDIADKYLLLSNSHDGQSGVQVKFTPIRVVCQNTLTMALSMGSTLAVKHIRSMQEQLDLAKKNLGIIENNYSIIGETFRAMAATEINAEKLRSYHELVFPEPNEPRSEKALARIQEARLESAKLFELGLGNDAPKVRGTLWAAYNGVTQYIDRRIYKRGPEQHLNSIWFGDGYLTKVRAFKTAAAKVIEWKN